MSKGETVLGHGPLPKRKPRYAIVRRRQPMVVSMLTAIRRKEAQERRDGFEPLVPGFTDREQALAHEAYLTPVKQGGVGIRAAGPNVPIRTIYRADGSVKEVKYPFGVTRHKNTSRRKVI